MMKIPVDRITDRGRIARAAGLAALLLAACIVPPAGPGPGAAAADAPRALPTPWLRYAQLVQNTFAARLDDESDEVASQLHAYLEDRATADSVQPPSDVIVRVWVTPAGRVARVAFASIGSAAADAELRAVLSGVALGEPPPPDMPQPIRLKISLQWPA